MKKIIALCVVGCVFAVSAFAQLNVGAYAKSYWIPYRLTVPEEGDSIGTTAVQVPWGDPNMSAGLNFDGHSEFGGLHLGVGVKAGTADGDPASAEANGWVWLKPLAFLPVLEEFKLWAGNPVDETLMGTIKGSDLVAYVLNGSWDGFHTHRLEYREAHYNTFTRVNPYSWGNAPDENGQYNNYSPIIRSSAMVTWDMTFEPLKGLYVVAWVAPEQFWPSWRDDTFANASAIGPSATDSGDDFFNDYYEAKEVYRNMQVGVGYDIQGIGFARLQYLGIRNVVEAAFQAKFIPDVSLDVGVKIPFEGKSAKYNGDDGTIDTYKKKHDYQVSAAATYRFGSFRLMGRVDTAFAGSTSYWVEEPLVRGLNLIAYLVPSYQFTMGTVGLDVGFEYEQKDDVNQYEKDGYKAGVGAWFFRDMGNAKFKAAVVSRLPLEWHGMKQPVEVFFPLVLEVGF